jgi:hypothetical protein
MNEAIDASREQFLPVKPGRPIFSLEAIRPGSVFFAGAGHLHHPEFTPAPSGWKAARRAVAMG